MITRSLLFVINVLYFSLFATCAVIMRLCCFPCMRCIWHGNELTLRIRRLISASFRLFWFVAAKLRFLEKEIQGKSDLQKDHGMIIVANHPTYIDYVLLASFLPEVNCLVKEKILHKPTLSGIVKNARYLVNTDGSSLLEECAEILKRGENILIFPEGTRTPHDGTIKLKKGFASLSAHLLCPLHVVTITCSEHFLDKSMKWYEVPPRIPKFKVTVDKILDPSDYGARENPQKAALEMRQEVSAIFKKALIPKE